MKKIYFLLTFVLFFTYSCELDDNIDPKAPTAVPAETLFTNALIQLVNQVNSPSVNVNISRLLVQYWQQTTYFTESRYNFQDRGIPDGYFRELYRDVLRDLKEAKDLLVVQELTGSLLVEKNNKLATIGILEAYAFQMLVDAFGDVPYTEALLGGDNSTPKYDNDNDIYKSLITNLQANLTQISEGNPGFGGGDLLYGGDMTMWKKFGGSLLLRLGLRASDAMAAEAGQAITAALANGVFESGEGARFSYSGTSPYSNGIHRAFIEGNRKDFLPTNTIIDNMMALEDPRLPAYFTQYEEAYVGAIAGLDGAQSYNNYSHFADRYFDATLEVVLMDYCEVEFFLAEAVEKSLGNVSGSAEDHYNAAISASLDYHGVGGSTDAYLAQDNVAYSTATGDYKQKIGTQKWIALYNRGTESWAEWRRLDYPILNIPEGMTYDNIPNRMPYPYDEGELNGSNYEAAASAIGGDNTTSRVFWDMN